MKSNICFYANHGLPHDLLYRALFDEGAICVIDWNNGGSPGTIPRNNEQGQDPIELVTNTSVRVGEQVETILGIAEEEGPTIVVLGTHAKGLLKSALPGSASRRVLDRSSTLLYAGGRYSPAQG